LALYGKNGEKVYGDAYLRAEGMVSLAGLGDWEINVVQLPVRIPKAAATCSTNLRERCVLIEFSPRDWLDARTFAHELGHAIVAASGARLENGSEERLADWIGGIILRGSGLSGDLAR